MGTETETQVGIRTSVDVKSIGIVKDALITIC